MTSLTSSLTLRMIDDVSKPARTVAQALKDAEANFKAVAKGMAGAVPASDRFVASLAKVGASKKTIEQVAGAWRDYAKSAGLAANSADWTKAQASGVRAWERQTVASLRQVEGEQKRFYASQAKALARPSGFSGGALASVGGMYLASQARQFAAQAIETYRAYSDVNAIMRPILDLSPAEQASLKAQQIRLGADTRYSPLKVAEAQKLVGERGVDKKLIEPYVAETVNYASAMNAELPDAVKTLEAYMFSTGKLKGVSDPAQAQAIIRKATDYATHLAKIAGFHNDEISAFFEYGGLSGHQAGLSDETLGAMAALMHRNQISGDKAGVAMRAISAKLVSPTSKGLAALTAMGIDYNKFTSMKGGVSGDNLALQVQRKFGKKLADHQIDALNDLSEATDESGAPIVGDQGAYTQAAVKIIAASFKKNKKGVLSAQDSKEIASAVAEFYKLSVSSIDTEGLIKAIAQSHATLADLNALFGFQQGSRAGAALQDWEELARYRQKLVDTPPGYAGKIADERLASFDGALKQLEGSIEALQTRVMSAFDNDGKGGGALTSFANAATAATNQLLALPEPVQRLATEAGAAATAILALKSAGVLASTVGLPGLSAAVALATSALGVVTGLGLGAAVVYEATKAMDEARLSPKEKGKTYTSDVLLGFSNWLNGIMGGAPVKPFDADAAAEAIFEERERRAADKIERAQRIKLGQDPHTGFAPPLSGPKPPAGPGQVVPVKGVDYGDSAQRAWASLRGAGYSYGDLMREEARERHGAPPAAAAAGSEPLKSVAPWAPGATPHFDPNSLDAIKPKAAEAKAGLDALNATVKPQVDSSSIGAAHQALLSFLADLARVGPLVRQIPASFAGGSGSLPALGSTTRGRFATQGVQGQ